MLNAADLPNDIAALKAMLLASEERATRSEAHAERIEAHAEQREARLAHLTAELSRRDAEIEHLKLVLAKLRRMQFGRSSEKLVSRSNNWNSSWKTSKRKRPVRDTLATPDTPALAASLARTELLAQSPLDVLALGIDAAASTGLSDPLTKMLAHQAGLAHAATFKLMDRAMGQDSSVEKRVKRIGVPPKVPPLHFRSVARPVGRLFDHRIVAFDSAGRTRRGGNSLARSE